MSDTLSPVALAAMNRLRQSMEGRNATLSSEQWSALQALVETFDRIAQNKADEVAYLSSLDPGVGKTTAIVCYLSALEETLRSKAEPENVPGDHPGALICVERIDQAKDVLEQLVETMGVPSGSVGIWTSEMKSNDIEDCSVLLTSHERVRRLTKGRPFDATVELMFRGSPRKLRIWDETFTTTRGIAANSRTIGQAIGILSVYRESEAVTALGKVLSYLDSWQDGALLDVPDWVSMLRHTSVEDILCADDLSQKQRELLLDRDSLLDIAAVSGKRTRISRYGNETASLFYRAILPPDIYPVVVTDASGRVRQHYTDQRRLHRVQRLPSGKKTYRNLAINVWPVPGGKSAWRDNKNFGRYIEAMAEVVNARPEESFLIVHHKPGGRKGWAIKDVAKALSEAAVQPDRIKYVTWGRHTATNTYRDIHNVILAGTLFYPESSYEALKRASAEIGPDHEVTPDERSEVRLGEHGHNILQALCRSAVRIPVGGDCGPCSAWIMARPQTGIEGKLEEWFPQCRVEEWMPSNEGPKPKANSKADRLIRLLEGLNEEAVLSFSDARERLGMSKPNFRKLTKSKVVTEAMRELGVFCIQHGNGKAFRKGGVTPLLSHG